MVRGQWTGRSLGGSTNSAPMTGGAASRGGASEDATSATGGQIVLTGGTASIGGSTHVATGGAPDCASRTPATCTGDCNTIYGSPTSDFLHDSVYVGCSPGTRGCTDSWDCAYPPDHPENCMLFSSGCFPEGWIEDYTCSKYSCPSWP
jgi:hypothetical protein